MFTEAIFDCTTVLATEPTNIKALYRRAQAQVFLEQYTDAESDLLRCLILDKGNKDAQMLLKKVKELHPEVSVKKVLISEEPEKMTSVQHDPIPHQEHVPLPVKVRVAKDKGLAQYKLGHYGEALECFTTAIKELHDTSHHGQLPSVEVSLLNNTAACAMKIGDCSRALQSCNAALLLDPKNTKVIIRRASAYETLERYQLASIDYQTATDLDMSREAREGLGRCRKHLLDNPFFGVQKTESGVSTSLVLPAPSTPKNSLLAPTLPTAAPVVTPTKSNLPTAVPVVTPTKSNLPTAVPVVTPTKSNLPTAKSMASPSIGALPSNLFSPCKPSSGSFVAPNTSVEFMKIFIKYLKDIPELTKLIAMVPHKQIPIFFSKGLEPSHILPYIEAVSSPTISVLLQHEYLDAFSQIARFKMVLNFLDKNERDFIAKTLAASFASQLELARQNSPLLMLTKVLELQKKIAC